MLSSLIETGKLCTDSFKKINGSTNYILKLSSPLSTTLTKSQNNYSQSREQKFKPFQNEEVKTQLGSLANPNSVINRPADTPNSKTQLSSLYQRAQKEVLNAEYLKTKTLTDQNNEAKTIFNKTMTQNFNLNLKLDSSTSPTHTSNKRKQTPQNESKILVSSSYNTNPSTRYVSPSHIFEKVPTVKKMLVMTHSKENETKILDHISPANETSKYKNSGKLGLSNYSQCHQPQKYPYKFILY